MLGPENGISFRGSHSAGTGFPVTSATRYGASMQLLCSIISYVVAMAGIWSVTSFLNGGWATAVGLALVVIVSFAHAGTLAPESLGWKRTQDKASS